MVFLPVKMFFSGFDPEIIVVNEGDASPPVPPQIVLDDGFNQLDELDSQSSQSILTNCGPGAVHVIRG